ncbi:MAG: acyl carrier protein [Saprospiraceae bacterium]
MAANPDTSTIAEGIAGFIKKSLVAEGIEVNTDTPFAKLGLDSFSLIEIVLFIERNYGVGLPDEALSQENIYSAETMASCVQQYLQAEG